MTNKPELLLPAGNIESFNAAIKAGADAVYVGLMQFNARGRARNFTNQQFISLLNEARKNKVLVYVTLNTIIKNSEIELLIAYLHFLNNAGPDGIIVQDWGVYYIASNFFPNLKIHASTQLGIHNSAGMLYLAEKGFRRAVLARELTLSELKKIVHVSPVETEIFVHGALCYSFSGMCLFSSFIGGRGANRGLCAQPCRRDYIHKNESKFLFNLKDNQLLDFVPKLAETGVSSFKIEGRLKPGEYTYRVGEAYRKVIDDNQVSELERKSLELDFGRQKTSYFIGGNLKSVISAETSTGIFLGKVEKVDRNSFLISSEMEIQSRFRLRILDESRNEPLHVVVKNCTREGAFYRIDKNNENIKTGSRVYLTKLQEQAFSEKLETVDSGLTAPVSERYKKSILSNIKGNRAVGGGEAEEELYFRIDSPEWFSRINFNELDGLFLQFSKIIWTRFDASDPFIQNNRSKLFIELPKFIAENSLDFYTNLVKKMVGHGIRNFVISHLSQKMLIPENCRIITSENVYAFNDAAITFFQNEAVENFVYPQEIDFETMESITHKNGIVPVYFFPELFYSRMPVHLEKNDSFSNDQGKSKFKRYRKNGVTIIVPDRPVSILQHKNKLREMGFSRYLIDVSYETFSKNRLKTLKIRFLKSEQIQPSTTFNFVKGLK